MMSIGSCCINLMISMMNNINIPKVILPYAELNVEGMLRLSLKLESQL